MKKHLFIHSINFKVFLVVQFSLIQWFGNLDASFDYLPGHLRLAAEHLRGLG